MPRSTEAVNQALEEFRAYLETLTFLQVDPRLRSKFGLSDIVQETLVEAWRELERLTALDSEGRKRRLRRMLVSNLLDAIEKGRAAGRDYRLEQPLEAAAAQSSCRLRNWLVVEDSSAGEGLVRQERAVRLLEALSQLDPRQREALILQRWHGWTLAQIAERLECTSRAVAGLHARGLKQLRKLLPDLE